ALLVKHGDRGLEVRTARRRAPVDDLTLGDTRRLVRSFLNRDAVDEVLELNLAANFRQDRTGIRIPLCDTLATTDLVAVVDEDARTIGHAVHRPLLASLVEDEHGHVAAHHHE